MSAFDYAPWKHEDLRRWSIVGMNHYHINGVRFLFVAMVLGDKCIKIESVDDIQTWIDLATKAREAEGKPHE